MKRIAITGATGMIGIHLIELLLNEGMEVIAFVHRNSNNISQLPCSSNLHMIELDLSEYAEFHPKELTADVMIHMGWQGTVGDGRHNNMLQQQNIMYSIEAVKLAKRMGCKRFVGVGSQAEYGRVLGKITEKTICNPESAYGKAKLEAYRETNRLCNELGIEHVWVRIFSVYGPHNQPDSMIMHGIRDMLHGIDVPFTKGEQRWDYLYVKDAVYGLWLITVKGMQNNIYCLGYGDVKPLYTYIQCMYDMVKTLNDNQYTGCALIGKMPYTDNQVMNLDVDISKLRRDTQFLPRYSFEEGIKETIMWLKGVENI